MVQARTVLLFVFAFALIGIALGTLLAPTVLSAELCGFTSDVTTSRPCVQTVRDATAGLLRHQGYGALGGGIVGLVTGIVVVVRSRKNAAATPSSDPSSAA